MDKSPRKRIVIIGGGFAGLNLAKHLDHKLFDVTIVDRNNFHSFPPLLYQVASGGLEPGSISFPFRRELHKRSLRGSRFHYGEVKEVDVAGRRVVTSTGVLRYDYAVVAAGTVNNFFGNEELPASVYTLKAMNEALRLRNDMLERMERAANTADESLRRRLLTFVVIGGGPTGVEIAGALGEMKRFIIPREYPTINPDEVQIKLFEGSDRLLRTMSEHASQAALRDLGQLMVEVHTGSVMKSYADGVVTLADGTRISTETVVWTAGVTGAPIKVTGASPRFAPGPSGRLVTDIFNRVEGADGLFAIGDISYCPTDEYPRGFPQLAQPAIQMGRNLAANLNAGVMKKPFRYVDKGSMATIGRNRAVADLKHVQFSGRMAWMAWMFIHLLSLLGMRNKAVVIINWTWAYFTYATSLRLILSPSRLPFKARPKGSRESRSDV